MNASFPANTNRRVFLARSSYTRVLRLLVTTSVSVPNTHVHRFTVAIIVFLRSSSTRPPCYQHVLLVRLRLSQLRRTTC